MTHPPKALVVSRTNPWRTAQSGATTRLRTIIAALRRDYQVSVLTRSVEGQLPTPGGVDISVLQPWRPRTTSKKVQDWVLQRTLPYAVENIAAHTDQVSDAVLCGGADLVWIHRLELAATLRLGSWSVPTIVDADDDETARIDQLLRSGSLRASGIWRNVLRSQFLHEERRRHAILAKDFDAMPHVSVVYSAESSWGQAVGQTVRNAMPDPGYQDPFQRAARPERMSFIGMMRYPPNSEAASELVDQILPSLRQDSPMVRCRIVGDLDDDLRIRLQQGGAEVLGFVPDVGTALQGVAGLMNPVRRGSGTSVKVIEALARGVPIISTAFGVRGLGLIRDKHYLEAATAEDFAVAWRQLTSDYPATARSLARAGRHAYEQRFSVGAMERDIRAVLNGLTPTPGRGS